MGIVQDRIGVPNLERTPDGGSSDLWDEPATSILEEYDSIFRLRWFPSRHAIQTHDHTSDAARAPVNSDCLDQHRFAAELGVSMDRHPLGSGCRSSKDDPATHCHSGYGRVNLISSSSLNRFE